MCRPPDWKLVLTANARKLGYRLLVYVITRPTKLKFSPKRLQIVWRPVGLLAAFVPNSILAAVAAATAAGWSASVGRTLTTSATLSRVPEQRIEASRAGGVVRQDSCCGWRGQSKQRNLLLFVVFSIPFIIAISQQFCISTTRSS